MCSVNPYHYIPQTAPVDLELKESCTGWFLYRVTYSSACTLQYPEVNTVYGEYLVPVKYGKLPFVILVHGLGDHSTLPCKWLARSLAGRGIASFIIFLPIHSLRLPFAMRQRFPNHLTSREWFDIYRVSVINIRQIIDWAEARSELDSGKIGLFGISMGGFISAITMAVDGRVSTGVFAVMGGNSATISRNSLKWRYRPKKGEQVRSYHEYEKTYFRYLEEVKAKGFEDVMPQEPSFLTDPLTFAHLLKGKKIFMINALWDEAIPRSSTLEFWEACGRPIINWFPATHAGLWAYYPLIKSRIVGFFQKSFNQITAT